MRKYTAVGFAAFIGLAAASVLVVGAPPAGAIDVSTEQELRDAFGDVAETSITLVGDIDLTCAGGGELVRNSATDIVVNGGGFTITQTCDQNRVVNQGGTGPLLFDNVTITGGNAIGNGGGGIWAPGGGSVTLMNSTVVGNTAPSTGGGGINAEEVTLVNSTVSGNDATDFGGGINVVSATLINSTVSGNTSQGVAGGVAASDVTVINSTVSGNTAGRIGGGIYVFSATLAYATVVDNTSPAQANVYAETAIDPSASVVALPQGGGTNCGGGGTTLVGHGYNFSDDASCGFTDPTDRESAGDPQLGALADNGGPTETRLPQTGSPLLNAIPVASCLVNLPTDQRGVDRPQGDGCDIGSVEVAVAGPDSTTSTTAAAAAATTPRFTG